MSYLQKIALSVLAFFVLSFVTGYVIWFGDITKHRSDLQTFIRLAVHDALINIQTTEEQGLNFTSTTSVKEQTENYKNYLDAISKDLKDDNEKKALNTIHKFLDNNVELYKQTGTGEALFRPIQFGMTYIDQVLFEASFKESLSNLIEVNYNSDHSESTAFSCYDALHAYMDDITIKIDGPHVVSLKDKSGTTNEFLLELYGINNARDYLEEYNNSLAGSSELGVSVDAVPTFYVYYDITVDVPWGSSTAFPFFGKELWEGMGFTSIQYSEQKDGQKQFIRWHSDDMRENYSYRYVLLN